MGGISKSMRFPFPLYETGGKQTKPLGFPMCQNRLAVPLWSYVMELLEPKTIIEIGSLNGGFTTALGVHAWRIGCEIYSFDTCVAPDENWKALAQFLRISFVNRDCFSLEGKSMISRMLQANGTTILMCDGGNKAAEFNEFAQGLKPGGIIAAHDHCKDGEFWVCSEIKKEDVNETVDKCGLEPFMQESFDMAGWLVYRKK